MKTKKQQSSTKQAKHGPVAQVWAIASKMPKAKRADVIAACIKAGVNEHTAKTQYQKWTHASPAQRKAKLEAKPTPTKEEAQQRRAA